MSDVNPTIIVPIDAQCSRADCEAVPVSVAVSVQPPIPEDGVAGLHLLLVAWLCAEHNTAAANSPGPGDA